MRDGYSTAGSPGTGLGALRRVSSWFDILSLRAAARHGTGFADPAGTVRRAAERLARKPVEVSGLNVPTPGEEISGDAWAVAQQRFRALLPAVDGLGHGADAARASAEAVRV